MTTGKQPGRRYGPPPKKPRGGGRTEPLDYDRRLGNYDSQNRCFRLTARQVRQLRRRHREVFATVDRIADRARSRVLG